MSGADRLRSLPKVELHRHLDGSVRLQTIWDIARSHGIDIGARSVEELRQAAVIRQPVESLEAALACFATQQKVLDSFETLSRVTLENIEDAWRDGVKLVELRFAPAFIAEGKDLSNDEIIGGVLDGVVKGMAKWPIEVGLIGILPRGLPLAASERAARDLARWKTSGRPAAARICGFDLAAQERGVDPLPFVPLVDMAREAGMGITVHSGEDTDAAHVERTLDLFRPGRIGHGIQAWGTDRVVQRLREEDVLLELCPTSNWLTRAVPDLGAHPLPRFYRAGVPLSINSDDPNLMGIDLVNEYEICARQYGLDEEDFQAINLAALSHSFLPPEVVGAVKEAFFTPRGRSPSRTP
ncbi:MAG TPA: adenosine deaminase [Spirochaetia bacterium]|nr:adenosine deaminase [Spirochaetia bacterium]